MNSRQALALARAAATACASCFASIPARRSSAAERDLEADEVQARRAGRLLDVAYERAAVPVEHAQMSDERLEPGAESRRCDDRVHLDPAAVVEHRDAVLETGEGRHDADASVLHRGGEADVDDRDHAPLEERRDGRSGAGRPSGARSGIAIRRIVVAIRSETPVGRCVLAMPNSWLGTPAVSRRTIPGGVRTESSTSAAPPSTRSTAISAPELPVPTTSMRRPRYGAALRYAAEWTISTAPAPGQSGVNGTLLDPVAIDDALGRERAARRSHDPAVVLSIDALDLDSRANVEVVERGVEREVLGDPVPCGPLAELLRDLVARQAREPAHRVQVQPVVPTRPEGADLGALEHGDALARAREHCSGSQPGRSAADDDDHRRVLHDGGITSPLRARDASLTGEA